MNAEIELVARRIAAAVPLDVRASVMRLVELVDRDSRAEQAERTLGLLVRRADEAVVSELFTIACCRGLVDPGERAVYLEAFGTDPVAARRALLPEPVDPE